MSRLADEEGSDPLDALPMNRVSVEVGKVQEHLLLMLQVRHGPEDPELSIGGLELLGRAGATAGRRRQGCRHLLNLWVL